MKGFFSIFKSSANELKNIRTVTVTGMLIAFAVAIRSTAIEITQDIRISFAFIAIIAIAVLYGPVVAGMANLSTDFLGYVISNHTTREYSIPLALVTILSGIIYGVICYKANESDSKKYKITPKRTFFICLSRVIVVFVNHICLNSLIIYISYVNKDFNLFNPDGYDAFGVWILPRIIKNLLQLCVDIPIIAFIIPIIITAYNQVSKTYSVYRKNLTVK